MSLENFPGTRLTPAGLPDPAALGIPARVVWAVRCTARKTSGGQCRAWAIRGGFVCRCHGGSAPQVRLAALRRLARQYHMAYRTTRVFRAMLDEDERWREAGRPVAAEVFRISPAEVTDWDIGVALGLVKAGLVPDPGGQAMTGDRRPGCG